MFQVSQKSGSRPVRLVCALLLLALPIVASASKPRLVSDAERAGVEIAANYLSRGPAAVVERLSSTSPLRKIPAADLAAEIETRLGPNTGATWQLGTSFPALADKVVVFDVEFPSGADDSVMLAMRNEGGRWVIQDIRMLALPADRPAALKRPVLASAVTKSSSTFDDVLGFLPMLLGIAAAVIAFFGAMLARNGADARRHTALAAIAIAVGGLVAGFASGHLTGTRKGQSTASAKDDDGVLHLARLLPLRRALASGSGSAGSPNATINDPKTGTTARLWHAQLAQQSENPQSAARLLSELPEPSDIPLAEVLRARAALVRDDDAAAAVAYENAISLGPGRDSLWSEAAQAAMALGFEDRAKRYFDRLEVTGSRDADVYYIGSMLASMRKADDRAAAMLQTGWTMRPIERSDLVEAAVFWETLRKAGTNHFINLSTPEEATFASPDVSTRAIVLPPDATARVSGALLSINIGDRQLIVPGGASLAPAGTAVVDAGTWKREEEAKGLADFPTIVTAAQKASAYTQPAIKQRIIRTARALSRHNRWADVLALTEGLDPNAEHVPSEMFFLRDTALQRAGRPDEGRHLVEKLAVSRAMQRKNDVDTLVTLGEMLASHDLNDAAIKVLERAHNLQPSDAIDGRIGQIQMNKRLATKYSTHKTEHFEIHYPDDVTAMTAESIGNVLESELIRLQKWVPVANFKPIAVNVVWWDEFRSTYTGSDYILGFFQRGITVPFAGIPDMFPEAVAVLSHELCHAMIAQSTNDQAPRWFHEGLASRIEMREYHENAFNMYDDDKLLALTLMDAVIGGSPDPSMISQGYVQSQTLIRYVESAYGMRGVQTMLTSFRNGATTEEAIQQLSGKTVPEFEVGLRTWGRAGSRVFENPPIVRYDGDSSEEAKWSSRQNRPAALGRTQ
jgi:tetratricopeptide (TPR) repeat protein